MTEKDIILERPELKNTPFSVPEGYFESLPQRVAERIAASASKPAARRTPLRRWWLAAAAACLVAVAATALWLNPGSTDASSAHSESEEYAAMAEWFAASGAQPSELEASGSETLSQDEIIEYLAYNDLSGEYIYTALANAE